jgi:glutamyl-tRNA synthetase
MTGWRENIRFNLPLTALCKLMKKTLLKTRFCPSPTGFLHLGNMRTALFNALLAKGQCGIFLLRIEDTDKTRSETHYTDAVQKDLQWLGLQWDEGPNHDAGAGPYWQSQRQAIYDKYYQQLEEKNLAYPCFCTEQQLALTRKIQVSSGKPPRYAGTCRQLTPEAVQEKLAQGLKPALRFIIPLNQETSFDDLVRGDQRFNNNDIGDFIIRRADGTAPFMYCNAIDDALMGVTHALRGEDHLTNTPRQIMILKALNLPIPTYGHISLIVGDDGAPLSKRHGSRSIEALREEGYLPVAIVNYLARLGHHYAEEHWMDLEQLSVHFSIKSLGSAPARFDAHQLLHWQHESVLRLNKEELWQWMNLQDDPALPADQHDIFIETVRNNITFPQDAKKWLDRLYTEEWNHGDTEQQVLREAGAVFFETAIHALDALGADVEKITTQLKEKLNVKGKALFQPLRVALTGEIHGPELAQIALLLGKMRMKQRLEKALNASSSR